LYRGPSQEDNRAQEIASSEAVKNGPGMGRDFGVVGAVGAQATEVHEIRDCLTAAPNPDRDGCSRSSRDRESLRLGHSRWVPDCP
jgi:hypothetical protein